MLEQLKEVEAQMPELLQNAEWNSLYIDYEKPHVERLWIQLGENRLYLHRILPCEEPQALFHPHPWPSAIKLLKGSYEMGVGYTETNEAPPVAAKIVLRAGASYEMTDINGWHYVRPTEEVLSIMLTGPKWDRWSFKSNYSLRPLTAEEQDRLKGYFIEHYIASPHRAAHGIYS